MRSVDLTRICKHFSMTPWRLRRVFPRATLQAIERAINNCESLHGGTICFVVEGALHGAALYHGESPRERALEVFARQRLWDTEHRNGVLIYVLLADRAVEIVADRGAHLKVGAPAWQCVCRDMEELFGKGRYQEASLSAIEAVGSHLARSFPSARTGI
jgi:uncharacterized membrane protein